MPRKTLSAFLAATLLFAGVPAYATDSFPVTTDSAIFSGTDQPPELFSITTSGPDAEIPEDPGFSDAAGHWAEDAIGRFTFLGILTPGEDPFLPDKPITRGELAALIQRIFRYRTVSASLFADVTDHPFAEAIQKLRAAGVMLGDEKNCALPDYDVTREEAMVLIARAFGFVPAETEDDDPESGMVYTDRDSISDWAKGYIQAMTAEGYLHGSDNGCFLPKDSLTRAEAITVFHNMITAYLDRPGEYNYRPFEGLANFVIIASDDVTLLNFDIGDSILLTEGVNYESLRLKSCKHYGRVYRYEPGGYVRYLKASMYIVPIDPTLPVCSYDSDLFLKDERGVMQYGDPSRPYWVGVDISSWQNEVDFYALKDAGVHFVFLRAGYRGYETGKINEDPYFRRNLENALAAGLKVGVYFFSQALNAWEAQDEARFVLDLIRGYDISYPVVFDWETISSSTARTNGMTTEALTEAARAFAAKVTDAGYTPMIYSNKNVSLLNYDLAGIRDYAFWYAEYADQPSFYYDFDVWQYTDSGRLPGVAGNVDLNISFVDFANR